MDEEKIIAGIDIGTTKIATVVARVDEYNSINIIGVGTHPSTGLRRGVVINIEKTIESIKKSVQQAELMAGYKIERAYAGIAGDHIRSINSKGVIAVSGEGKIIDQRDVDRVIDAAKAIALPMDRQIVHILPQEYINSAPIFVVDGIFLLFFLLFAVLPYFILRKISLLVMPGCSLTISITISR